MKLLYRQYIHTAHRLSDYFGRHVNIHGHSFLITVEISGNIGKSGMIIDTDELKKVIDRYDHTTLLRECRSNEELVEVINKMRIGLLLMSYEPTLENIAKQISEEITGLGSRNVKSVSVHVKILNKEAIYFGYSKE